MRDPVAKRWLCLGLLAAARLLACAHAQPPAAPPAPAFQREEAEARIREEMSSDPFAEVDAGPPPSLVAAPPTAPPPAPSRDPRAEAEAALAQLLASSRSRPAEECARALHQARRDQAEAGPTARQALLAAEARCEEKAKDLPGARESALFLLTSCGPEGVDRCRARASSLARRLARAKPRSPEVLAQLDALEQADHCLAKVEASSRRTPEPCAASAEQAYRHLDDKLMLSRLRLAEARAAVRAHEEGSAERLLARAIAACSEPRCEAQRGKAFDAQARLLEGQKRYEDAAAARLAQNQLAAASAPPERRRYTRLPALDQACARLDAQRGPGSCRALELKTTGGWTFHDWSARQLPGDLEAGRILQVNEEYAVTLQECFREQALRLPVPSNATYALSWMIGADGRVAALHLRPAAEDQGPLASCLRDRFSLWRYPRSTGENQHVDQSFTLTAKPR